MLNKNWCINDLKKMIYEDVGGKLKPTWCECSFLKKGQEWDRSQTRFDDESIIFVKDFGVCECGTNKHHYHCRNCGKLLQIG